LIIVLRAKGKAANLFGAGARRKLDGSKRAGAPIERDFWARGLAWPRIRGDTGPKRSGIPEWPFRYS
jgi:hypothetical protein